MGPPARGACIAAALLALGTLAAAETGAPQRELSATGAQCLCDEVHEPCHESQSEFLPLCHELLRCTGGEEGMCEMRDLWHTPPEAIPGMVVAAAGAFCISAFAVLAGVGGGGMLVPLYMNTVGASTRLAVPMSQATILGSSILNVAVNIRSRHPNGHSPVINYGAAGVLMPMTLAGTTLGKVLGNVLPGWLKLLLLCALLGYTLKKTVTRAVAQHAKEVEQKAALAGGPRHLDAPLRSPSPQGDDEPTEMDEVPLRGRVRADTDGPSQQQPEKAAPTDTAPAASRALHERRPSDIGSFRGSGSFNNASLGPSTPETPGGDFSLGFEIRHPPPLAGVRPGPHLDGTSVRQQQQAVTEMIHKRDDQQYPIFWMGLLLSAWTLLALFSYRQHEAPCGGPMFWLCIAAVMVVNLGFAAMSSRRLRADFEQKVAVGFEFGEDDIRWDLQTNSIHFPLIAVVAGVGASLLGIGGGMVLGPMLYEMGLVPQVQSATSGLATFFVASGTVIQFALGGDISAGYPSCVGLIGLVAAVFGHFVIGYYIRKSNRTSLIIWAMVFIISGSMVALTVTGALDVYKTLDMGGSVGFRQLCPDTHPVLPPSD
eukprot:TRINITY_DN12893_c0_g1_i1.p1 TRINITY_DN12893_c0_g1~~TRINITY_DN12893_c0_g1_i1.p1  ORF type:complete len:625 (+),score=179.44 TRINITY_DN12893_c0_g1_i1:83-1876(+)